MKNWIPVMLTLIMAQIIWGHGISEADKLAIVEGGNLRYLWLGAGHMLTGYDHLLFLFGVIFYLTGFKDILKFITAFTLGHSITLVFATFLKITANFYLVDAVIALSVCYKAFDNLDGFRKYLKINSPHLLAMVFGFGLIHGFGLSTRLQELPLPSQGLLTRILSFNVGVELGQVAALTVLVALLAGWRRTESFRKLGGVVNILLLGAGSALFIYQVNGYFRGDADHHGKSHGAKQEGHSHGSDTHSHGEDSTESQPPHTSEPVHSHGSQEHGHDHGDETPHQLYFQKVDSATVPGDSALHEAPHGHSHEEGHNHDEQGHSHKH